MTKMKKALFLLLCTSYIFILISSKVYQLEKVKVKIIGIDPSNPYAEAETACQNWGGSAFMKWWGYYVHSEYIRHRLLHSS